MRRIQAACLEQTIHFMMKDGSVILKIKRQYNNHGIGNYFD